MVVTRCVQWRTKLPNTALSESHEIDIWPFYSVKVFHLFFQVAAETYFDCMTVRNSFYQTRYCAELWSEHKILWLNLRTQSFELSSLSIDLCFVVSEVKILWKEA